MKRFSLALLVFFVCGCAGERASREHAGLLLRHVDTYEKNLEDAVQKESDTYKDLVSTYDQAWKRLGEMDTGDVSYVESVKFSEKTQRQGGVTFGDLTEFLNKTADTEYQMYKNLQDKRQKIRAAHIKAVSDLTLNKRKIEEVVQALEILSTKPSVMKRAEKLEKILLETLEKAQKKGKGT